MIFGRNNEYKSQEDIILRITQGKINDKDVCIRILNSINTEGVKTYGDLIRKLRKYGNYILENFNYLHKQNSATHFNFNKLICTFNRTDKDLPSIEYNPFKDMLEIIGKHYYSRNNFKQILYKLFLERIKNNDVTLDELISIIIEYCENREYDKIQIDYLFPDDGTILKNSNRESFVIKASKEYKNFLCSIDYKKVKDLCTEYAEISFVLHLLNKYTFNDLSLYPHIEKELPVNLDKFRKLEPEPKREKWKEKREVDEDLYYAVYNRNYKEE